MKSRLTTLLYVAALPLAVVAQRPVPPPPAAPAPPAAKSGSRYEHIEIINGDTVRRITSDEPIGRWRVLPPDGPRAPRFPREPEIFYSEGLRAPHVDMDSLMDDVRSRVEILRDRDWREPRVFRFEGNAPSAARRRVWSREDATILAGPNTSYQVETKEVGDSIETIIRLRQPKNTPLASAESYAAIGLRSLETNINDNEFELRLATRGGSPLDIEVKDASGKVLYQRSTTSTLLEHRMELPRNTGNLTLTLRRNGQTYTRTLKR